MRRPTLLTLALLLVAVLAVGCGGNGDDEPSGSEPEPAAQGGAGGYGGGSQSQSSNGGGGGGEQAGEDRQAKKPEGTTIKLADSQFGQVLFDADDQAIYSFDKEQTEKSECYGECAVEWPPVLTKGEPQAKGAVAQGKLGTTERRDGTTQVTYAGKPLYYYFDEGPGELLCHNVPGFGGLWLAVDKSGNSPT